MQTTVTSVKNVLTRTTGYLKTVTSHSLQPYRGCSFGHSLCGVGCYVQHNGFIVKDRVWGSFLEVRANAAASYVDNFERERRWARRGGGTFGIFLSSSTEPFLPQESRFGVTREVLEAMLERPPDLLVLQTHSHRVASHIDLYEKLRHRCQLRVHVSIETDRDTIPGLPAHASSVDQRFSAASQLKKAEIRTVITVSPILPLADAEAFFARIAAAADAVVIDHFIEGDGSTLGERTRKTPLVNAIRDLDPVAVDLHYRDQAVAIACRHLPDRVGVSIDGFAGRYLRAR